MTPIQNVRLSKISAEMKNIFYCEYQNGTPPKGTPARLKRYIAVWVAAVIFLFAAQINVPAATDKETEGLKTETISQGMIKQAGEAGNDPAQCEWFKDQALGMFIHWSVDCPLGAVISHHLIGSSKDYQDRFFSQMPGMFYPKDFKPEDWARLAKLVGMKYVVFTTKHHAGFCMWDTQTTDFSIMNTPYHKDITRELFDAFRAQGIKIGIYFCVTA